MTYLVAYSLELRRESSWAEEDAVDRRRHGTRKTQLFYHLGDKIICIWKLIKVTFMQCSKKRALVNGGEIICRYYKIHREINQFHGKCIVIPFKRSVWIDITGFISGGFCKSFGRGFPIGHWNPFPIHNINTRAGKFGRIRESFTLYCTRLDTKNPLSLLDRPFSIQRLTIVVQHTLSQFRVLISTVESCSTLNYLYTDHLFSNSHPIPDWKFYPLQRFTPI